jgi:NAD(P)-dependent dehydrogenase (short-subunit alcohol dehydrogenase family)
MSVIDMARGRYRQLTLPGIISSLQLAGSPRSVLSNPDPIEGESLKGWPNPVFPTVGLTGSATSGAYASTKGAVTLMTRNLALMPHGLMPDGTAAPSSSPRMRDDQRRRSYFRSVAGAWA